MKFRIGNDGGDRDVEVAREDRSFVVALGESGRQTVEILDERAGSATVRIGERNLVFDLARDGEDLWLSRGGRSWRFSKADTRAPMRRGRGSGTAADPGGGVIRAPMPALVIALDVAEGEVVEGGHTLLSLEAMKMETRIAAPAGTWRVFRLHVVVGKQVLRDQELLELVQMDGAGTIEGGDVDAR